MPQMAQRADVATPWFGRPTRASRLYLAGQHHPQKALSPRIAFIALAGSRVVGYIAGHHSHAASIVRA